MSDFNETYADAINSNSEERTSSMSDYSTSTTPDETQYQENTPTITPEIVDAGTDVDLIDTNPVAALAENFQNESSGHPLAPGETNYTEEEARRVTEDLKVKLLHALEAQYDFTHAAERAFDGHIWVALDYPEGMKGWIAYCADNFAAEKIRVTGQQRTDLITGFTPGKISNRGIAALLGVSEWTVRNTKAKAGITSAEGRVRSADGRLRPVDTGSMSSEERRKKIVELSEEGAKQTDIADILDVSQSTVSDTLRKDRMRRMSEGLEPAKIAQAKVKEAQDALDQAKTILAKAQADLKQAQTVEAQAKSDYETAKAALKTAQQAANPKHDDNAGQTSLNAAQQATVEAAAKADKVMASTGADTNGIILAVVAFAGMGAATLDLKRRRMDVTARHGMR